MFLSYGNVLLLAVKKDAVASMSCEEKETRAFGVGLKILKTIETKLC